MASSPASAGGEECLSTDPPDCGVPVDATLRFRFDRFLDPATANRQALRVYSGDPDTSEPIPFAPNYDVVERVVSFAMPEGYAFQPRTLYQVELLIPVAADDFGFRAFDGAPLAEGGAPLRFSFLTSEQAQPVAPPATPTCGEIVNEVFFALGGCGTGECHANNDNSAFSAAPEGLWLDQRASVRATAIDHVARQTETGDRAGVPLENPLRFGVQMPVISPGNAGNSYLMYKLLRAPQNFEPCDVSAPQAICGREAGEACASAYADLPLAEGSCLEPSVEESTRLREWFVRGEPMPLQRNSADESIPRSVRLQGLRALQRFIVAGADCSD